MGAEQNTMPARTARDAVQGGLNCACARQRQAERGLWAAAGVAAGGSELQQAGSSRSSLQSEARDHHSTMRMGWNPRWIFERASALQLQT